MMSTHDTRQAEPVTGLENDEDGARIVQEELRLLSTVQRTVATANTRAADALEGRKDDDARMIELREQIEAAKPEDLPTLFEQMHNLGALRGQRGKSATGTIDLSNPYFGHLRLEENGKRRDVLVGGKSYLDPGAGIRIVDWRHAPVSRIYYRYSEGDDYEESLGDRLVEGCVVARRSVAIIGGALVRVASPQGTFVKSAEGRWRRVEAQSVKLATEKKWGTASGAKARLGIDASGEIRTDKHLPAIASMLDPAQFDLITRPQTGLVVVQGSAGSGKTTVGLHRVGYLAFADPNRYRPDRMMVVVPNDALVHYVDRVLPTLGVEGVPVSTFSAWASKVTTSLFPKLPGTVSEDTPAVVSRAKRHPAMLRAIDAAAARATATIENRIVESMAKWPSGQVVVHAWKATGAKDALAPDSRVSILAAWLAGKRTIDGVGPSTALPDVTRGAVEQLGHEIRSLARSVLGTWDELLTSRERLGETFAGLPGFGPGQLDQAHAWCLRQARVRAEGERDGETPSIDAEDRALLLRVWQTLRGPLLDSENKPLRVAHLFVDEVQDASPVELRVLLDLTGQERNVTLAGDVAQRMLFDDEEHDEFDWHALLRDLGMPHVAIEPLKVSYRSTAEITTFARKVLGPFAHDSEPIATRHGPSVELFSFSSIGEGVAFLADALRELAQDEPYANVALVARFPQQAEVYFDGLSRAEVPHVRRVAQQDFTWEPGVDVTDVRQTKGLEFDEVILLDTTATSYPETPQARHALYVASTRAAHQLWCVSSEAPSKLVTGALES